MNIVSTEMSYKRSMRSWQIITFTLMAIASTASRRSRGMMQGNGGVRVECDRVVGSSSWFRIRRHRTTSGLTFRITAIGQGKDVASACKVSPAKKASVTFVPTEETTIMKATTANASMMFALSAMLCLYAISSYPTPNKRPFYQVR